jgi:hypothetical protein
MRNIVMLLGAGAALVLGAACAEEAKPFLGPENNLTVVNQPDTFSLAVDDLKNVYTELSYTWENSEPRARVFHCSFLPHGEAHIVVTDAVGDTVYDREVLYRLEGISFFDGTPGDWTVSVGLYGVTGAWLDFVLDATADSVISGALMKDVCEARGR